MIIRKNYLLLGKITKIHFATKVIYVDTRIKNFKEEKLQSILHICIEINYNWVPFKIQEVTLHKQGIKITLNTPYEIGCLQKNQNIWVEKIHCKNFNLLNDDVVKQIKDYKVYNQDNTYLGKIYALQWNGDQYLMQVRKNQEEVLIPYHEVFIQKIIHKEEKVKVILSEDFLENFVYKKQIEDSN